MKLYSSLKKKILNLEATLLFIFLKSSSSVIFPERKRLILGLWLWNIEIDGFYEAVCEFYLFFVLDEGKVSIDCIIRGKSDIVSSLFLNFSY